MLKRYALVLLVAGCGDPSSSSSSCEPRSGQYREHWITESGDCGDISDTVIDIAAPTDPACVRSSPPVPRDQCGTFDGSVTCMTATATTQFTGNVTWPDGTRNGTAHFGVIETLTDGSVCNGIYTVQFTPF